MSYRTWIQIISKNGKKRQIWIEREETIRQRAVDYALLFACRAGDYRVVAHCLHELRSDPDTSISHFRPALMSAIGYVRADNEADVNARLRCVKLMLDHGANINFRDGDGDTPLACAIRKGCIPIVEELVNRGAVTVGITGDQAHIMQVATEDPTNTNVLEYLQSRKDLAEMFVDYWASLPGPGLASV